MEKSGEDKYNFFNFFMSFYESILVFDVKLAQPNIYQNKRKIMLNHKEDMYAKI